jgi:LmbE family N-acetylglucosaminyl deacetylase
MSAAEAILAALAEQRRVAERVTIVAAHPDDETLGMGALLCRFGDGLLVHATDGAPRDGEDARNYGFATPSDYAAARRQELTAALSAGGADHLRTRCLGVADKQTMADLAGLTRRIADLLRDENPVAVFTHAYEGGHPDHDAVAFAVHAACRLHDAAPAIIEFPLYHRRDSRFVTGQFVNASGCRPPPGSMDQATERRPNECRPPPGPRCWAIALGTRDLARKRAMLDCFATQRWLFEPFDVSAERFRLAPGYDFRELPHAGELHYETLGWGITGDAWRRGAAAALDRLGLCSAA